MDLSPKQMIATADDKLLFTEDCITVQYDKESKSTEDNLLYYINETENNVGINYVEVNTSTEEDILLPTEIENYNMVKYGKENLSTKDNLLYIDINETENKIVNEETEDSVTDILTNDQEHLITNKNRNYESKSIDEAWGKHLFWPKPDNIDLNKKNKQPRLKLPYAVSAKQWREHHSKIEQAKLQKEEELCLKRKRREEIKNAKLNESSQKIKKNQNRKKLSRNLKNILIVLKMMLIVYIVMSHIAYLKVESPG